MINIESLVRRVERIINANDDYLDEFTIYYEASINKWHVYTLNANPHTGIFVEANTLPEALKLFKEELKEYK